MNVHDGNTVITETIYSGELGRIVAVPSQRTLDAWDCTGQYLGGFSTPDRALNAMNAAYALRHRLTNKP